MGFFCKICGVALREQARSHIDRVVQAGAV